MKILSVLAGFCFALHEPGCLFKFDTCVRQPGSFSPCFETHISDGYQYYYQRELVGLYYDITHSMLIYKQIDRTLVTSYICNRIMLFIRALEPSSIGRSTRVLIHQLVSSFKYCLLRTFKQMSYLSICTKLILNLLIST